MGICYRYFWSVVYYPDCKYNESGDTLDSNHIDNIYLGPQKIVTFKNGKYFKKVTEWWYRML